MTILRKNFVNFFLKRTDEFLDLYLIKIRVLHLPTQVKFANYYFIQLSIEGVE